MAGRLKNSEFYSYSNENTDDSLNKQIIDFVDDNLVGHIFHVTSSERLGDIQASGFLKPATEHNTFKGQSKKCYAKQKGWICLFDFRSVTDEQIEDSCQSCLWDLMTSKLTTPVVLIINEDIHSEMRFQSEEKLLYSSEIIPGLCVQDTECWYPGNLSLENISVLKTNFKK